jgi:hypothetical protein
LAEKRDIHSARFLVALDRLFSLARSLLIAAVIGAICALLFLSLVVLLTA